MKTKISILFSTIFIILFSQSCVSENHSELKAFPAASEGMTRWVISLPEKTREQEVNFKVELIPGKMLLSDNVNLMRLGNILKEETLNGWGYNYYVISDSEVVISTLMAPTNDIKQEKFISGKSLLINYNSRLPIVIYAPANYLVKYRIWSAGDLSTAPFE